LTSSIPSEDSSAEGEDALKSRPEGKLSRQGDGGDSEEQIASREELALLRKQLESSDQFLCSDLEDIADGILPKYVARFRIQEVLGSGTFGTVYVAFDPLMSRNVAVKVARLGTHLDPSKRERFFSEAHAAARLANPNVVTVHEYGEDAGLPYIVYHLVIGPTLDKWMADRPDRVAPSVAIEIIRQVAQGLSHAHSRGIVHRDVKPSNIVLQESDAPHRLPADCPISFAPLLTDFGLAIDQYSIAQLAEEESFVGTIDYMSPEQVQGRNSAQACTTDIFSLGVLMYRLLTGYLPFRGSDSLETLKQICSAEPIALRHIHPSIPRDLEAICLKCIQKDPRNRYPTSEALLADLACWRLQKPVSVRPRPRVESLLIAMHRAPLVVALTVLVILTGVVSGIGLSVMNARLRQSNRELARLLSVAKASQAASSRAAEEIELQNDQIARQLQKTINVSYRADIQVAFAELNAGRLSAAADSLERVERLLKPHRSPGIEYKILHAAIANCVEEWTPHAKTANAVCAVPNSKFVISCGDDGRINFYNSETGKVEYSYYCSASWTPTALSVDASGQQLAVGWSISLLLGTATSMTCVYPLCVGEQPNWIGEETHQMPSPTTVESLSFSADGQRLAVGPRYEPVVIWNLATETSVLTRTANRNRSVEFSPDSSRLLIQHSEPRLMIFDAVAGQAYVEVDCESTPQFSTWSPDGKWIAFTTYNSNRVTVISSDLPKQVFAIASQSNGPVETICFSPDSKQLVAGTRAGSVVAWNMQDTPSSTPMEAVFAITPHAGVIRSLEVVDACKGNVDCRIAISVDDVGSVISTILAAPAQIQRETPTAILGICQSPNLRGRDSNPLGNCMLAGYQDGQVVLLDEHGVASETLVKPCGCAVTALAASGTGELFAVGWVDGRVAVIEPSSPNALQEFHYSIPDDSRDELRINSLQFSADGRYLAACGDDARLRLWGVAQSKEPLWQVRHSSLAYSVCFVGPNQLACGGMFEKVGIYDVAKGRLIASLVGTARAKHLLYDPTRNVLVSGHEDGRLRIHDAADWTLKKTLVNSAEIITSLCLAPCKSCYVSGHADGKLALWDAQEQIAIGSVSCLSLQRPVSGIAFLRDRLFMLTCCPKDNELRSLSLEN
jgi:eukaryotic-like serine/threonine-protein kinase